MEKHMLEDGSKLIFQMFYVKPDRILSPSGKPIQGTLGFVGALLKILRMTEPTHAAVLFDGEYVSPRGELSPDYKANRPDLSSLPEEDTPFSQLPDICRALELLGIPHGETAVCECDDWLAAYARQYGGTMEVVIASQDSDLFQLISQRVRILRYRGEKTVLWTPEHLQEKLGIKAAQYADFKALTGDTSDNIRGLRGVGPKTAGALMQQFGTLEALLERAEEIKKPALREAVLQNKARLRENYALIHLDGLQELPFPLEALAYQASGLTTTRVMKELGLR